MTIDFGLSLTAGPEKGKFDHWLAGQETLLTQLTGHFRSMWMTDHFFWNDKPTYEAWTVIAYMAARWPRFDIGSMVLGQSYRNPALLAKMASTLQMLSKSSLILGIGAGWKEDEYLAYGYEYPSAGVRVAQLGDTLEILKRMWTEPGQITYKGEHYQIIDAWCEPKPDPPIPILVGGGGKTTTRLAVQYADIWNYHDAPWSEYKKRLDYIQGHCDDLGRNPATLRLSWFGRLVLGKTEKEALERGGGKWTPENAFVGTPEQITAQMQPFVEAGVDYFMIEIPELSNREVMHMLLKELLPAVQALA